MSPSDAAVGSAARFGRAALLVATLGVTGCASEPATGGPADAGDAGDASATDARVDPTFDGGSVVAMYGAPACDVHGDSVVAGPGGGAAGATLGVGLALVAARRRRRARKLE